MDTKVPKIMPPLWIWLLLLFAVAIIGLFISKAEALYAQNEFSSREVYIKTGFDSAEGKPVVLIIGASLVQCDLDSSRKLEACIQSESGCSPVVLKLWKVSGRLSTIVDQMPILNKVQPALVILEANMLFYKPFQGTYMTHFLQEFRRIMTFKDLKPSYLP